MRVADDALYACFHAEISPTVSREDDDMRHYGAAALSSASRHRHLQSHRQHHQASRRLPYHLFRRYRQDTLDAGSGATAA